MAVKSLEDAHRIEVSLLEHPLGTSLAGICRFTGIPKSTAKRHLDTMVALGRVELTDDRYAVSRAQMLRYILAHASKLASDGATHAKA